ncbi:MAG: ComF family protein [Anaerolineales bacterium]|nr:ComF family protein [Anaerolineales bacterium]
MDRFLGVQGALVLDSPSKSKKHKTGQEIQDSISVWSDVWYQPPVNHILVSLKYRPSQQLAESLAQRLADLYHRESLKADLVAAVPLGSGRLKQRGYNQVELLARPLADLIELPCQHAAIFRTRETRSQVGLTLSERKNNVQEAFQADEVLVNGKRVLLVDDVCTTGATLFSCALALYSAGAREVTGLTVARAKYQSLSIV